MAESVLIVEQIPIYSDFASLVLSKEELINTEDNNQSRIDNAEKVKKLIEKRKKDEALVYTNNPNNPVQAGTINQLILCTIGDCYPVNLDGKTFLQIMDSKYTTEETLKLIQNVCFVKESAPGVAAKDSGPVSVIRLSQFLYYWIARHPKEFERDTTVDLLKSLFKWMGSSKRPDESDFAITLPASLKMNPLLFKYSSQVEVFCQAFKIDSRDLGIKIMLDVLSSSKGRCRLRSLNKSLKKIADEYLPPPPKDLMKILLNSGITKPREAKLEDLPPKIVAHELSVRFANQLMRIHPSEWEWCGWIRSEGQSPTLREIITDSNQVTNWIQRFMLEENAQLRKQKWKWVVQLAKELRVIENFNTLMMVVTAFNGASIHRLRSRIEFSKKDNEAIEELERLLTTERNFRELREAINSSKANLPYLGLFLTDLTFIHDGHPQPYSGTPLIDLWMDQKKREIFSPIIYSARDRVVPSSFALVQDLIRDMLSQASVGEADLYKTSLKIAPRQ